MSAAAHADRSLCPGSNRTETQQRAEVEETDAPRKRARPWNIVNGPAYNTNYMLVIACIGRVRADSAGNGAVRVSPPDTAIFNLAGRLDACWIGGGKAWQTDIIN